MKVAIRKHWKDFLAIIGLIVLSLVVAGFILSNERLKLPGWVPFFGRDFYTLKAEMSTAQSVTPGQGQTVNIAGVQVGEINKVDLVDGRAVITMKIKPKYDKIYPNATILLRPKTGLKDMIAELDPGSKDGGKPLKSGSTIPVSQTLPDVNLDEILSSLDTDTRSYLQLLVHAGGEGLRNNGKNLQAVFKRFDPTLRDLARVNGLLATRQDDIRHVVHNFALLSKALAGKDQDLATLVDSSNAVFRALADQDQNLRASLRELPPTLTATRGSLNHINTLAANLGPTLQSLRPGARALAPAQQALRPLAVQSTPIIKNQLRPFTRDALPTIKALRPAANALSALTPNLIAVTDVANYALNELAWDPPGNGVGQQSYLFYNAWTAHDGNTVFSNQDAMGPIRRGQVIASCSTLGLVSALKILPAVGTLLAVTGLPTCPIETGPGSTSSAAAARAGTGAAETGTGGATSGTGAATSGTGSAGTSAKSSDSAGATAQGGGR
jgi:phospholipid/cholesterol/gamma-HCH transport system substrate-binding protein